MCGRLWRVITVTFFDKMSYRRARAKIKRDMVTFSQPCVNVNTTTCISLEDFQRMWEVKNPKKSCRRSLQGGPFKLTGSLLHTMQQGTGQFEWSTLYVDSYRFKNSGCFENRKVLKFYNH